MDRRRRKPMGRNAGGVRASPRRSRSPENNYFNRKGRYVDFAAGRNQLSPSPPRASGLHERHQDRKRERSIERRRDLRNERGGRRHISPPIRRSRSPNRRRRPSPFDIRPHHSRWSEERAENERRTRWISPERSRSRTRTDREDVWIPNVANSNMYPIDNNGPPRDDFPRPRSRSFIRERSPEPPNWREGPQDIHWRQDNPEYNQNWERSSVEREVTVGQQGELTIETRNYSQWEDNEFARNPTQFPPHSGIQQTSTPCYRRSPPRHFNETHETIARHQQSHFEPPDRFVPASMQQIAPPVEPFRNYVEIPEFDPMVSPLNALEWIDIVKDAKQKNGWNDEEARKIVVSRLRGISPIWIEENTNCPFNLLLINLKKTYVPMTSYPLKITDMARRIKVPGETYMKFFEDKMRLLHRCRIGGKEAISCVVQGLPSLKKSILDVDSLDALREVLMNLDNGKKLPEAAGPSHVVIQDPNDVMDTYAEKQSGNRRQTTSTNTTTTEDEEEGNGVMRGILSKKLVYKQYFKRVLVNNVPMSGYVDLGSENVTIRQSIAYGLNLRMIKSFDPVRGFGGGSLAAIGKTEITLRVDDASASVTAYIIPDHLQIVGVIVGQSFTESPHIMIFKSCDYVRFSQKGKTLN